MGRGVVNSTRPIILPLSFSLLLARIFVLLLFLFPSKCTPPVALSSAPSPSLLFLISLSSLLTNILLWATKRHSKPGTQRTADNKQRRLRATRPTQAIVHAQQQVHNNRQAGILIRPFVKKPQKQKQTLKLLNRNLGTTRNNKPALIVAPALLCRLAGRTAPFFLRTLCRVIGVRSARPQV